MHVKHADEMVRILPQTFYENPVIQKVLVDGLCCAVFKKLDAPEYGKEGYISAHALTMILRGTLRVENDEGLLLDVPAGTSILMPKGLYTVSDLLPQNGSFEAVMYFFEPDLIQQFLDSLSLSNSVHPGVSHALIPTNEELSTYTTSLLRLYGNKPQPHRLLARTKLFELLHLLDAAYDQQHGFAQLLAALNNKARKSLREFMLSNFHKPLGIEDYAYLSGRSVSTFTRDFKSKFDGVAPKQWLIEQRLERARELLGKGQHQQISEIALEAGYLNIPHFIKEFHKRFGITPKQFMIENRIATPL